MADTNVEVKLRDVRLSFDNLFMPQEQKSEKTGNMDYSYNCVLLLDKVRHADQIAEIVDAMTKARDAAWPGQNKRIPPDRRCLQDGEPEIDGVRAARYEGYEGAMYLSAKRKLGSKKNPITSMAQALALPNPVQLIGPRKTLDPTTGERRFVQLTNANGGPALLYGGAFVNAIVRIYGYSGSADGNPDRLNCSLEVVQHKRHGTPFGARKVDANSAMDEEEGEDEAPSTAGAATKATAFDPLG